MRRHRGRRLLAVALCAAAGATPTPADTETAIVLPSETCRGLFLVPVTLGRGTTVNLLLDTGSSWTFLDPGALRRIVGGPVRAGEADFPGARIGPHDLGKLRARVLSMRGLSLSLGREIDGILGFPAFRDVLLTLDYPAREVRVARGSLPRPDGRTVFRAPGKRPHLDVTIGDRRFRLQIDSGATGRFQLKPSDAVSWSVDPRPATRAVVVGGVVVKRVGRLDGTVRFGPLAFEDPLVTLGGRERQVGWHVLRHLVLTFDARNRRVRIETDRREPVRMAPFAGFGLADEPRADGLRVVRVFPGGPAEAAGLRAGDRIVAIDGKPVPATECDGGAGDAGRRRVVTYVRDGIRREIEIEVGALVP